MIVGFINKYRAFNESLIERSQEIPCIPIVRRNIDVVRLSSIERRLAARDKCANRQTRKSILIFPAQGFCIEYLRPAQLSCETETCPLPCNANQSFGG